MRNNCEYLENGKSQRYMSIRTENQLDGSLLKCIAWNGIAPEENPL